MAVPVAITYIATAKTKAWSTGGAIPAVLVRRLIVCLAAIVSLASAPPAGAADKVRLTGLTDVAFGAVGNLTADAVQMQNICIYSSSSTSGYHVAATGTGAGGSFELSSGIGTLPFDVAWNSAPGQTSGTLLTPSVPLTGQVSSATQQTCNSGPATTGSLIIILRSTGLSSAMAGTYNGTLTLVVGPE